MNPEILSKSATVAPALSASTALVGAHTVFEPASGLAVGFADDTGNVTLEVAKYPDFEAADDISRKIAEASLGRAESHKTSARAWSQAGFASLAANNLIDARDTFCRALNLDPRCRSASLGLARTAHQEGRLDEAERILRDLLERDRADVEARVSLAVVLMTAGSLAESLALLEDAADIRIENASLFATRGGIRFGLADYRHAISDLRKALRLRPDWPHVRNVLALAELQLGRTRAAEQHFREAVRVGPMYREPLLNLLRLLRSQKRWNDLLDSLEEYWSPGSGPVDIAIFAGEASLELGSPRAAKIWLEPVRHEGEPRQRAMISNNLGVAYSRLGQWADAEAAFGEAVHAFASEVAVSNHAKALLELDQPNEAAALLLRWHNEAHFESTDLLQVLSVSLLRLRREHDALAIAEHLIGRPDADEAVHCLLSSLYADHVNNLDGAIAVASAGLAKWAESSALKNNLSYALILAGRFEEAESWIATIPEDIAARKLVYVIATKGLLELRRGRIQEGQASYERALGIAPTESLRERVKAKRDLEVGRALLHSGRLVEARKWLKRASEYTDRADPYVDHAKGELARLTASQDDA